MSDVKFCIYLKFDILNLKLNLWEVGDIYSG